MQVDDAPLGLVAGIAFGAALARIVGWRSTAISGRLSSSLYIKNFISFHAFVEFQELCIIMEK